MICSIEPFAIESQPLSKYTKGSGVFALQLGRLWKDLGQLKDYELALFAVFAAKANRASEDADQMLRQLSKSATGRRSDMNFQGVKKLLSTHGIA